MRVLAAAAIVALCLGAAPGLAGAQSRPPLTPYVQPDQRWSVLYPADRLRPEELPNGAVAFVSPARDAFAIVDTDEADGSAMGNTGEGFRNRARETLAQVVGPAVQVVDFARVTGPRADSSWWDAVVTYTACGLAGRAYYAQPDRSSGDSTVRGVLLGGAGGDAALAGLLEAVRDSYLEVRTRPLQRPGAEPLWAVYSVGMRAYRPEIGLSHFVALYRRGGAAWQPVGRVDLDAVDYQDERAVTPASIDPGRLWLAVEGGAGAHGGTFHLLSFDGASLKVEVAHQHPSPGAGELRDLLGDGSTEVILDESDPYVFCYACAVRLVDYRVLRWDGAGLAEVTLRKLPDDAPVSPDERRLNDRAVDLARAGLYLDALVAIGPPRAVASPHPIVVWNQALIDLVARGRAANVEIYPLLGNVFYGDYAAAVRPMRGYGPVELFAQNTPLVAGTPADGFRPALVDGLIRATTAALGARPDLAEAYFLRGWARNLAGSSSADALADVARAAELAPSDPLFAIGQLYLRDGTLAVPARRRVTFGAEGTAATVRTTLVAGQPQAYVLRVLAGQHILVDRDGLAVLDPDDRLIAMTGHDGGLEVAAGRTGEYTVVAFGSGAATFTITVPPPR